MVLGLEDSFWLDQVPWLERWQRSDSICWWIIQVDNGQAMRNSTDCVFHNCLLTKPQLFSWNICLFVCLYRDSRMSSFSYSCWWNTEDAALVILNGADNFHFSPLIRLSFNMIFLCLAPDQTHDHHNPHHHQRLHYHCHCLYHHHHHLYHDNIHAKVSLWCQGAWGKDLDQGLTSPEKRSRLLFSFWPHLYLL